MEKTELKIKDNITMEDKIAAIDAIVDSCFVDGDYTPYNLNESLVRYIVLYCIEGYDLEANDNLYKVAEEDEELNALVIKFFKCDDIEENEKNFKYIEIQEFIMRNVALIVDYKKNRLINCADLKEEFFVGLNDISKAIIDISENIKVAAKPILENPDYAKHMLSVLKKLDSSDVIDKNIISDVVIDIVKNNM